MKPRGPVVQALTKQQLVYGLLRDAIIKCELAPGEPLVIEDLTRRFHIGAIPLREAIRLLQSEGLVVTVPHAGTSVAPISVSLVHEVFAILESLEAVSTRAAAERATRSDLDELAQLVDTMDAAIAGGRAGDWADLNSAFHLTIGRLARMPLLEDLLRRAFDNWDRLRRHFFHGVLVRRIGEAQADHHRILAHMRARDLGKLAAIVRAHNHNANRSYSLYLQRHP